MEKNTRYTDCAYYQKQGEGCLISLLNNGFIAKCIKKDTCFDLEEHSEPSLPETNIGV